MSENQVEGIVLNVIPFRDHDRIFTLFTRELGIVKAIMKKSLLPKLGRGATDPLTRAEMVLQAGRGDLMRCIDISIQNQYLKLREELSWLTAACRLAQAISLSQMPHKAAPDLYRLLISYLEKIPLVADPHALISSFYLKLLRHEGLFHPGSLCARCDAPLNDFILARGESYCKNHTPSAGVAFTFEEMKTLEQLNHTRSFKELASITLAPALADKVQELFTISLDS